MLRRPQGEHPGLRCLLEVRLVPGFVSSTTCHSSGMLRSAKHMSGNNSTLFGPTVLYWVHNIS